MAIHGNCNPETCDETCLPWPSAPTSTQPANICLASEDHLIPQPGSLEAHIAAIEAAHIAAFREPVWHQYQVGQVVWLYDHYNTGVILREVPGRQGTWQVSTTDANGEVTEYQHHSAWLRPAAASVEFRWPEFDVAAVEDMLASDELWAEVFGGDK